ncbi:MAG: membrane or secreted protein [bacterium]|nr:membrane or secreted protein [bacterium]
MMYLFVSLLIGCGPSGRDISDASWLQLQQDMQDERAEVGRQRDQLEADRREWDERERSEPVFAAAISSAALLFASVLPLLLLAGLLLQNQAPDSSDAACNVLLDQMADLTEANELQRIAHQQLNSSEKFTHQES